MNRYLALVHILAATAMAVTTFSQSCQAGSDVTTFPACNAYLSSGDACSTVLDRPGKEKCLCNQRYLDSVYGCENELRLCFRSDELTNEMESVLIAWSSLCTGTARTFTPTTPPAASFSAYPDQFCQDIKSACFTAESLLDECITYAGDTTTESWSSCTCRSSILRLDYTCEYMGNKTCLGIGATLSSVWGYMTCDNFASVIGTGLPDVVPPGPTTFPSLPGPTPSPGSTTIPGPVPSSSKPSSGCRFGYDVSFIFRAVLFSILFHTW